MPKITIDGHNIDVPEGVTILQAAKMLEKEIPVFCYHERLSIAGNCRMCLVEVERAPKPVASCAMPVAEGMVIHTKSPMVEKARKGVLEFLLINHPLDCPICDQGGECDLQDITMGYGRDASRFELNKRAVENKPFGPLVRTFMNRCIHCTRCVRFATEVAGAPEIGAIHRGEHMEITTYLDHALTSELSGNVIDLCPVGALTSKPYAFKGRPWELTKTQSIDVMDAVGSSIRIDTKGREVMRILPRLHDDVNEEWLSDKARFSYDGLKSQRLDRPYVRTQTGQLKEATWDEAFDVIASKAKGVSGNKIAAIAGNMVDVESMYALKHLMSLLKSPHLDCRQNGVQLDGTAPTSYLYNTTIAGTENTDFCILVGTNPRYEAPLVNTRIRKAYVQRGIEVVAFAPLCDMTYPVSFYDPTAGELEKVLTGKHPICAALKTSSKPMIIVGEGVLSRPDGAAIHSLCAAIAEKYNLIQEGWNGFNVLSLAASRVGGLHMHFLPQKGGLSTVGIIKGAADQSIDIVYLLNADEIDTSSLKNAFVIYQGHHGDKGAACADVILPGAAYTEKTAHYVNMEGRVQKAHQACLPPGDAKEDWKIIRALSQTLSQALPYDTREALWEHLTKAYPIFTPIDHVTAHAWQSIAHVKDYGTDPFTLPVHNFYMTDVISRHSATMAKCSEPLQHNDKKQALRHG